MFKKTCNKKKKRTVKKPNARFVAMSKLIGIFIGIALFTIIAYAMYEMHIKGDLSSLPQLIISVFGIGSIYIGFYLTMAKWEHVEIEKTNRYKDLLRIKKSLKIYDEQEQLQEDLEACEDDINELKNKEQELENQDCTNNY